LGVVVATEFTERCRHYTMCEACIDMVEYYQRRLEVVNDLTENYCEKDIRPSIPRYNQCTMEPDLCQRTFRQLAQDYDVRILLNKIISQGCEQNPCPPMKACSLLTDKFGHSLCPTEDKGPIYVNEFVSLRSYEYPDHFVAFPGLEGLLLPITNASASVDMRKAATFRLIPGLLDNTYIYNSIESVLHPGWFVSHNKGQLVLRQEVPGASASDDLKFDQAATWKLTQGLVDHHWVSVESVDLFGHFIRNRNFTLRLERENDENHSKQSTWRVVNALYDPFVEEATRGRDWERRERFPTANPQAIGMVSQNQPNRLAWRLPETVYPAGEVSPAAATGAAPAPAAPREKSEHP
jgi:hypothetical protein